MVMEAVEVATLSALGSTAEKVETAVLGSIIKEE
jgi:hypothetical protein